MREKFQEGLKIPLTSHVHFKQYIPLSELKSDYNEFGFS